MTVDRAAGGRATRQRAAVRAVLDTTEEFRSAQELHGLLRQRGESVGLTTVYRSLQLLADAGEIDAVRTGDGEYQYRRCAATGHHHHLVCRRCGTATEIEAPSVERWASRVAAEHGFTGAEHTVEIFGVCPQCTKSTDQS
jgi:Fur family ferric uptake transcriptional regulator